MLAGRRLIDQSSLSSYQIRKIQKWRHLHKRDPDLIHPKTFTEKLLYRCLFSRDPYYHLYASKINAPFFLQGRRPDSLRILHRYGAYQRISPQDLWALPVDCFMIKSSWASGLNCPVPDRRTANLDAICNRFNKKLHRIKNSHNIPNPYNSIIVEEFLGEPGRLLEDFKFHCIRDSDQNLLILVQHYMQMEDGTRRQSAYDIHFNHLDYSISAKRSYSDPIGKPKHFDSAVQIAHQITAGFDYIRLDLYLMDDGIYFGEFTPYQSNGITEVTSPAQDERLGKHWNLRLNCFQPDEPAGRLLI